MAILLNPDSITYLTKVDTQTLPSGTEVDLVSSPKHQVIPAPSSVAQYIEVCGSLQSGIGHRIVGWRGQADILWDVEPSAIRRLRGGADRSHAYSGVRAKFGDEEAYRIESETLENSLVAYETDLIQGARHAGHGRHEGRDLSDLELMALLQHYGAATRLLDVSRNALVALWFSASAAPMREGLILGFSERPMALLKDQDHVGRPVAEVVQQVMANGQPEKVGHWTPPALSGRMAAQEAGLLLMPTIADARGTLGVFDWDDPMPDVYAIAVSKPLKADFAEQCSKGVFGYRADMMFPDLAGFANYHSPSAPL